MLVLSRSLHERIVIRCQCGECLTVAPSKITGNGTIRLAFDAPATFRIVREELDWREPEPKKHA